MSPERVSSPAGKAGRAAPAPCFFVEEYAGYFAADAASIMGSDFLKIYARSHRPFGGLYAY